MVEQANITLHNPNIVRDGKATQWPPGQSPNPAGRPKNSVTTLLKNTDELTNQQIAEVIIREVLAGNHQFVETYLDRTEGKVTQPTDHTFTGESLAGILLKLRGYNSQVLEEGKEE